MANSIFINVGSDSSGGSGGGSLPTAPKGQVLVSQGAGIPPIFSSELLLRNPSDVTGNNWKLNVDTGGNLLIRLFNDAGTFVGGRSINIDPYSATIASTAGGVQCANNGVSALVISFLARPFANAVAGAQGAIGNLVVVTDSTVNTSGSTVSGGGTFTVLIRWDGTNWKVV